MEESKTGGKCDPKVPQTYSKDLLDVGKNIVHDPLLIGKKRPYRMPPSSVLSQVKSFLPRMQEANCKLEEQLKTIPAEDLDIETVAEDDQQVIEMNLALYSQSDSSSDEEEEADDNNDSPDEDSDSDGLLTPQNAILKLPNAAGRTGKPKRTMVEEMTGVAEVKGCDAGSEVG